MSTNPDTSLNGRAGMEEALHFVREHVDDFVDGTLDASASDLLKQYGEMYPACHVEIESARELHAVFNDIETPTCPQDVVDSVVATVSKQRRTSIRGTILSALPSFRPVWQPALVLATAAVVVFMLVMPPASSAEFSDAEIDQAVKEVKWTLAYLGDVGKRTGETIRDDVLAGHVVSPINETLLATFD